MFYTPKMNRRVNFSRANDFVTIKASIPAYVNAHPLSDYEPIGQLGTAWIGLYRQISSRQLVVVQRCRQNILSGFLPYLQLAHLNIARPIALYGIAEEVYLTYEYVELEPRDLLPVSDTEIASILSQKIMTAVDYIVRKKVAFRIQAIRLSANGLVKIVPDWSFESTIDSCLWQANLAYVAHSLENIATSLAPANSLDPSFMEELKLGLLPSMDVRNQRIFAEESANIKD
ncbi:hypothetical protein HRG_012280 [Hirsutella rhossiliensis]